MSILKQALRSHGIKQKDLAAAIGTTESSVSRMVNGEQGIDLDVAVEIAKALTQLTGRTWTLDELAGREVAA